MFFYSITMSWLGQTKISKEKFNDAKKAINIFDVNVNNIVVSELIETKINSKYLIVYLHEVMVDDYILKTVLDKIKEIISIERFDDTKILIDIPRW